jgi:hypothetical protein
LNPHIPNEAQRWLALVACGLLVLWFPHALVEIMQVDFFAAMMVTANSGRWHSSTYNGLSLSIRYIYHRN